MHSKPSLSRDIPKGFLFFFSVLAAVSPFAMQVYMPAIPEMVRFFGSNINVLNSTISSYMIGNALGQLIGGPISDQVGRKTVASTGLGIFLLATLWIIFAPNIEQLILARMVQAVGGGFATVICLASVRDVYPPLEAGRRYALVLIFMLIAPMLAPFIGGLFIGFWLESHLLGSVLLWAVCNHLVLFRHTRNQPS